MGVKVEYTGPADERVIRKSDWDSVGVENQDLVRWDHSNNFMAEVSDDAAKYLDEKEDNFKIHGPARTSGADQKGATTGQGQGKK